jgi:hypothetical protein
MDGVAWQGTNLALFEHAWKFGIVKSAQAEPGAAAVRSLQPMAPQATRMQRAPAKK